MRRPTVLEQKEILMLTRRNALRLAASTVAMPFVSTTGRAQAYPNKPVRIFVGFPPGGAADTLVRIVAQWFSDRLGQPFVIENRPGAATNLSIQAALAAPPDGYTLVFVATSTTINATLYESSGVNFMRDGSGIGAMANFPHVIAASPTLPATDLAQLISYARSNPGKISAASYGTGTTSHLAIELLKSMANINL